MVPSACVRAPGPASTGAPTRAEARETPRGHAGSGSAAARAWNASSRTKASANQSPPASQSPWLAGPSALAKTNRTVVERICSAWRIFAAALSRTCHARVAMMASTTKAKPAIFSMPRRYAARSRAACSAARTCNSARRAGRARRFLASNPTAAKRSCGLPARQYRRSSRSSGSSMSLAQSVGTGRRQSATRTWYRTTPRE